MLAGLTETGLHAAGAERIVGTSAGAYVGTLAAFAAQPPDAQRPGAAAPVAGEAFGALLSAWVEAAELGVAEQRRRVGALALAAGTAPEAEFLAATAARLPDGDWPEPLVLVAVDAESGERIAFGHGDGVPLVAALAALRAVPGLRPPIGIGGRRYMDGAVGSATNADLAAGAERVVIVTPTPAEPPAGTLFAVWDAALEGEIERLRGGGAEVLAVRANAADLDAMGPDLMSAARADEAFRAGRLRGRLLQ